MSTLLRTGLVLATLLAAPALSPAWSQSPASPPPVPDLGLGDVVSAEDEAWVDVQAELSQTWRALLIALIEQGQALDAELSYVDANGQLALHGLWIAVVPRASFDLPVTRVRIVLTAEDAAELDAARIRAGALLGILAERLNHAEPPAPAYGGAGIPIPGPVPAVAQGAVEYVPYPYPVYETQYVPYAVPSWQPWSFAYNACPYGFYGGLSYYGKTTNFKIGVPYAYGSGFCFGFGYASGYGSSYGFGYGSGYCDPWGSSFCDPWGYGCGSWNCSGGWTSIFIDNDIDVVVNVPPDDDDADDGGVPPPGAGNSGLAAGTPKLGGKLRSGDTTATSTGAAAFSPGATSTASTLASAGSLRGLEEHVPRDRIHDNTDVHFPRDRIHDNAVPTERPVGTDGDRPTLGRSGVGRTGSAGRPGSVVDLPVLRVIDPRDRSDARGPTGLHEVGRSSGSRSAGIVVTTTSPGSRNSPARLTGMNLTPISGRILMPGTSPITPVATGSRMTSSFTGSGVTTRTSSPLAGSMSGTPGDPTSTPTPSFTTPSVSTPRVPTPAPRPTTSPYTPPRSPTPSISVPSPRTPTVSVPRPSPPKVSAPRPAPRPAPAPKVAPRPTPPSTPKPASTPKSSAKPKSGGKKPR